MKDLICNQRLIPPGQWRYGFRSSAATGCGWIATYNAMCLMNYRVNIDDLIRWYTWQLPLIHGNMGTTALAPALRFRLWGFPVRIVVNPSHFDEAAKNSDVCILFFRWRRGMRLGAHFTALHHSFDGFIGYNTFKNSTGPDQYGSSLSAFLKKHRYFGAILICVKDKRSIR